MWSLVRQVKVLWKWCINLWTFNWGFISPSFRALWIHWQQTWTNMVKQIHISYLYTQAWPWPLPLSLRMMGHGGRCWHIDLVNCVLVSRKHQGTVALDCSSQTILHIQHYISLSYPLPPVAYKEWPFWQTDAHNAASTENVPILCFTWDVWLCAPCTDLITSTSDNSLKCWDAWPCHYVCGHAPQLTIIKHWDMLCMPQLLMLYAFEFRSSFNDKPPPRVETTTCGINLKGHVVILISIL